MEPMHPPPSRMRHNNHQREEVEQAGDIRTGICAVPAGGWQAQGDDQGEGDYQVVEVDDEGWEGFDRVCE